MAERSRVPEGAGAPVAGSGRALRTIPGYLEEDGPPRLDPLVHGRLRLGIISALAVNDELTFTELRDLLKATDGNVSVHARKLEDAGYVSCTKSFVGRTPRTAFQLTDEGRAALEAYLDHMERLITAMRG